MVWCDALSFHFSQTIFGSFELVFFCTASQRPAFAHPNFDCCIKSFVLIVSSICLHIGGTTLEPTVGRSMRSGACRLVSFSHDEQIPFRHKMMASVRDHSPPRGFCLNTFATFNTPAREFLLFVAELRASLGCKPLFPKEG